MVAAAPRRMTLAGWAPKSNVGGVSIQTSGTRLFFGITFNTNGAQNDEFTWDVLLDAGTWALDVIHQTGSAHAIVTYYLDATSLGTVDGYSASTVENVVSSLTGITVAAAGYYTLKMKATSKHASSSGYYFAPIELTLRRTGA